MKMLRYHTPFTRSLSMKVSTRPASRKPALSYSDTTSGDASRKASRHCASACSKPHCIINDPTPFPWKAGSVATISRSAVWHQLLLQPRSKPKLQRTYTSGLYFPSSLDVLSPTLQTSHYINSNLLLGAISEDRRPAQLQAWIPAI